MNNLYKSIKIVQSQIFILFTKITNPLICIVDQTECDDNEISCDNGKCIPRPFACDGVQDCDDGADEEGCPPQKGTRALIV